MLASFVVSHTALAGAPKAFPKLSPQTSTLRIHTTFDDASAGAKLSKDCAAAALKPKACRSRGGSIKMQAVAAGSGTMTVAQACAFMQDPALADMSVEAKLEFLASKGVDPFVAAQASCTSLGGYAGFGPVQGVDGKPAAPAAPAAAPAAAAPAAAPAPAKANRLGPSYPAPAEMPYPTDMLLAMGGYDVETGGGIWDPLKLAAQPEADLKWYRQAEIKHGRVAMLACVGYLFTKLGFVFSGAIARDGTTFASIAEGAGSNPFAAWALVPLGGKIQDAETARKREMSLLSELKNGRLAMIGIAGFYASETIPGSVPFHL